MSNLKDSQTFKNIKSAFMGESMARNRYTFYEEQAHKEGKEDIAALYARMAKNEMIHARLWFKLMDALGDSSSNLQESADGEHMEWKDMYPEFAEKAKEEGFDDIARLFEQVAGIEHDHELTFLKAYAELKSKAAGDTAPVEEAPRKKPVYRCMFCGAVYEKRPDVCPVCGAIGSFEMGETNI